MQIQFYTLLELWTTLICLDSLKEDLVEAFKNQETKFLVISFSSDWLYTTKENKDTVIALNAAGADVSFAEIKTDKGHDSFLVNEPEFLKH